MSTHHQRVAHALLSTGAVGTLLLSVVTPAHAAATDLEAQMQPTAAAPRTQGHAEYEVDDGARELEVSLRVGRRLAGARLVVRVHGDAVGAMRVGAHLRAHLERHSGVPALVAGDVVRVRTRSGHLVARGTLRPDVQDDHDDDHDDD